MRAIQTAVEGVLILEPKVYGDERGFFFESWNQQTFRDVTGLERGFVQDNHSRSSRGVLRGLHYQLKKPQGKLVRVVHGSVLDVAIDIRRSSPTFGQHVAVELSEENKRQLWVPEGCAHGFLVKSEFAEFLYKTTDFYDPADEYAIAWNDNDLAIEWGLGSLTPSLSEKDRCASLFSNATLFD
jgi:dTDP-4-dehydrorhamnose 3,5-epimerase